MKINVTFLDSDGAVVDLDDESEYDTDNAWLFRHHPKNVMEDTIKDAE